MDAILDYDMSRYDFTEETWLCIFDYESRLMNCKLFRKVNFRKGETEGYISWIKNIVETPKIKGVISGCIGFKENKFLRVREFEAKYKLANSFKKNKYFIPKIKKYGLRYSFEDIAKFLTVLDEAKKYECLYAFISIPDVWYILKNIRSNFSEFTDQIILKSEKNNSLVSER